MFEKRARLGYNGGKKALNDIREPKSEKGPNRLFFTPAAYDDFEVDGKMYPGLRVFMTDFEEMIVENTVDVENFAHEVDGLDEYSEPAPALEEMMKKFEDLLGIGGQDQNEAVQKEESEEDEANSETVKKSEAGKAEAVIEEEQNVHEDNPEAEEEVTQAKEDISAAEEQTLPELIVREIKNCIDELFEEEITFEPFYSFDVPFHENTYSGLPLLFNNIDMNFAYVCDLFPSDSLHHSNHFMHIFDINATHRIKFNLSTAENPKNLEIGSDLRTEITENLKVCLKKNEKAFAWGYEDMPGIDRSIAQHFIPTDPDKKPVKQKRRRIKPEWAEKIKVEITKQLEAGFLKVVQYPEWLANIVPVPKKDGRVRMCVDYRDLNKASPKDDFPLPHIDVLIDNAAGKGCYSIMDGFSGYNQIKMAVKDREKTAFITEYGTFCYKVMPFGLKNAEATYQRMATTLFHDMIHKDLEVYIDDMVIMTRSQEEHVAALEKFMKRIRKYNLRLNPNKCEFGVASGKLLGFVVGPRGIEIDPDKIKAIRDMEAPQTEKQVRSFIGKIQYISRFISKLSITCEPIFRLLKKNQPTEWNQECQEAFEKVKAYLTHPPVLSPPKPGNPLVLYVSVEDLGVRAMLAQANEFRTEHAIYYISKKLSPTEIKYSLIEKTCLAVVWAIKKLQHYFKSYKVTIVSKMDPMQYLYRTPILAGKLSRWLILMSEFDIEFATKKTVKGRAVAEFSAENPVDDTEEWDLSFPDEHLMAGGR